MGFLDIRRKVTSSARQEKRIATEMGGRRVAGSGSQQGLKGDVKAERWLVEAKESKTGRFSLTLALWRKIFTEAVRAGREPAMVIELAGRKLVVIDYNAWLATKDSI